MSGPKDQTVFDTRSSDQPLQLTPFELVRVEVDRQSREIDRWLDGLLRYHAHKSDYSDCHLEIQRFEQEGVLGYEYQLVVRGQPVAKRVIRHQMVYLDWNPDQPEV